MMMTAKKARRMLGKVVSHDTVGNYYLARVREFIEEQENRYQSVRKQLVATALINYDEDEGLVCESISAERIYKEPEEPTLEELSDPIRVAWRVVDLETRLAGWVQLAQGRYHEIKELQKKRDLD